MIFGGKSTSKKYQSDSELVSEYTSGLNPEILGELYSRYMHLVYGVALKYLKNRDDAMDAVMQIFEKLITDLPRHKIENFKPWLHVVTRNFCLMQLRGSTTKTGDVDDIPQEKFMEYHLSLHPVDDDERSEELEKALLDCIEKLKEEQKRCINLFYYKGKCYSEIAYDLGTDEKKVKSFLQNGKRNLKLCLEGKNEREE
jgi:RNA polymerase sigma-70 factor (ECF subfamily)